MIRDKKLGHDLAQKTEAQRKLKRMKRGARTVTPGGGKGPVLALVLLALLMGWLRFGLMDGLLMGGLLGRLYCIATGLAFVALAVGLTMTLFWVWGGPRQASRTEENLARINYTNANGEVPELLSITRDPTYPKIKVYEFGACGLPVSGWRDRVDELQAALNVTVLDVQYGQDNQHIKLTVAPPVSTLPSKILWSPTRQPLEPFVVALGEDCAGRQVTWDLRQGHGILAGMTGSGKSNLLRCVLAQCLGWGCRVEIADFKGMVGFSKWQERCRIYTTAPELLALLEELVAEMEYREKRLSEEKCEDADEYNHKRRWAHPFQHIVLAVDEASLVFNRTGATKEQKAMIDQIERHMVTIACKGRALSVHTLLSMQRPDSLVLAPQIKANASMLCCGVANKVLSEIVLDSTAAADMIPRNARGMFVVNQGADNYLAFQAYYFDERRLNYG